MTFLMFMRISFVLCVIGTLICLGVLFVTGKPMAGFSATICVISSVSVWCSIRSEMRSQR